MLNINTLQHIHNESNHPPNIIKQIPIASETRLSNQLSNETVFRHPAEDHEKALKKSGYKVKLQYQPTNQNTNSKINRKRKIIWFNPSFSKTVSTKIGHYFLNLLDKHFTKNHKFHSIFNRNNFKFSYSCTKIIKSIITNHNKTIVNNSETLNKKNTTVLLKTHAHSLNSNRLNYDEKYYKDSCETTFK